MEKFADFANRMLPALAVVLGGLWSLYTYIDHARVQADKEQQTRLLESQKPFFEKQLSLYFETTQVIGQLTVLDPKSDPNWEKTRQRFYELYWSELALVESGEVAGAMVIFGQKLDQVSAAAPASNGSYSVARNELHGAALEAVRLIRSSIEGSWHLQLSSPKPPKEGERVN